MATVAHDHADPAAIRSAMGEALAHRLAPGRVKLEGRSRAYAGFRMLDMIGDLAQARGERLNLRDQNALMERAVGAHSTSDFPLLLADAANKALLANYAAAEPTYRLIAARRSFTDFRDHSFLRIGDFPTFQETNEAGELKYGTLSENREKVRAKELNAGIAIGRRALINDDLSALADFSSMIAIRAASDENARVYGLLAANAALSDGKALFHADHGNKATTGAALSVASVALAVASLRKQKSLDGVPLNLAPPLPRGRAGHRACRPPGARRHHRRQGGRCEPVGGHDGAGGRRQHHRHCLVRHGGPRCGALPRLWLCLRR
ncbi:Mu-like prophage major head subunit gpT family protein [Ancylobacter dichloromethanicus]